MSDETASGGYRLFDTGEKCARCNGRMVVSEHSLFGFFRSYSKECQRCGWLSGETPKHFRNRRIFEVGLTVAIALALGYFMWKEVLTQLLGATG